MTGNDKKKAPVVRCCVSEGKLLVAMGKLPFYTAAFDLPEPPISDKESLKEYARSRMVGQGKKMTPQELAKDQINRTIDTT